MEKYELKNKYEYEDDEIDLVELLKTIIRERKTVATVAVFFVILTGGFIFYKNNKPHNYGVSISLSEDTVNKINQCNTLYKNSSVIFNQAVENSFDTLLKKESPNIVVLSSEDKDGINKVLKEKYNFVKIIDTKNKNYKLFTKIKSSEIKKLPEKIDAVISEDTQNLNFEFNKNISEKLVSAEKELSKLTEETNKLNESAMEIIQENFSNISNENINSSLSIISPVLYVEYQEKINSLNDMYLKVNNLKKIKDNAKKVFELSGKNNITVIEISNTSENSGGLNSKIILAAGLILGLFAGMFIAIIKEPLKNIIKEIKEVWGVI